MDTSYLDAIFPLDQTSYRIGKISKDKGKATCLFYVESRPMMDRFDMVFGKMGWEVYHLVDNQFQASLCTVKVYDRDKKQWVSKQDGAEFGTQWVKDDDNKSITTNDPKGTFTSAFRRACVPWGVGRYLYDLSDDAKGRYYPIDQWKKFTNVAGIKDVIYQEFFPKFPDGKPISLDSQNALQQKIVRDGFPDFHLFITAHLGNMHSLATLSPIAMKNILWALGKQTKEGFDGSICEQVYENTRKGTLCQ